MTHIKTEDIVIESDPDLLVSLPHSGKAILEAGNPHSSALRISFPLHSLHQSRRKLFHAIFLDWRWLWGIMDDIILAFDLLSYCHQRPTQQIHIVIVEGRFSEWKLFYGELTLIIGFSI